MQKKTKLSKADELILDLIKAHGTLSTYDIAKRLEISWSTANVHCYRLLASGLLKNSEDEVKIGVRRVTWRCK